jgi:uncharacterized membrane protein
MLSVRDEIDTATRPLGQGSDRPRDPAGHRRHQWRDRAYGRTNGEILPLPVTALAGSPFTDYFVPGAILFTILGLGPLGTAVLAWRRHPVAPFLTFAVGAALLIWLIVEIAIIGYSNEPPLQPIYLGLGIMITLVGAAWWRQAGLPILR